MKIDASFVLQLALYMSMVIGAAIASMTILGAIALHKAGTEALIPVGELVVRGDGLRMLTVIMILGATTVLVILGFVSGEAGVTIFSGIAGYVLGGATKKGSEAPPDTLQKKQE